MDFAEEKTLVNNFLKTGSESHFRLLYRKYSDALFRLALHLNDGDRTISEDVVQETWIRAIAKLPGFRWQSSLKTWLSGFVINCSRELKRRNYSGEELTEIFDEGINNIRHLENKMDVGRALNYLPEGYREILILHDMEGYTHQEIGELLGISEGTSKSQLFNARKKIQKLIA